MAAGTRVLVHDERFHSRPLGDRNRAGVGADYHRQKTTMNNRALMRCSEPGESVVVAIVAARAPGR